MFSDLYIEGIKIHKGTGDNDSYIFGLPVLKNLIWKEQLSFKNKVTFFVGENGTGDCKSFAKSGAGNTCSAKAATVTAKSVGKATLATVKAVITAVKGLVTAIAAGGWIAIAVIVVIAAVGFVFCSPLGIFASEQGYEDNPSMPEVVAQINSEFSQKIDSRHAA